MFVVASLFSFGTVSFFAILTDRSTVPPGQGRRDREHGLDNLLQELPGLCHSYSLTHNPDV